MVEQLRLKHGYEAVIATDIRKAEGCQILDVMDKEAINTLVVEQGITEIYHLAAHLRLEKEIRSCVGTSML